jgi:mRNA interferase MazF
LNPAKGSEIQKIRPAVIISSDLTIGHPVRLVVPITGWDSTYGRVRWIVPISNTNLNGLEKPSAAHTTATRSLTVSVERFKQKLGILEPETLYRIAAVLADVIEFREL